MTCMICSLQCFPYTKSQFDVGMLTTLGLENPIHVLRREWQVGAQRGLVPQLQSCALSSPSLVPAISLVGLRTAPGEKHRVGTSCQGPRARAASWPQLSWNQPLSVSTGAAFYLVSLAPSFHLPPQVILPRCSHRT